MSLCRMFSKNFDERNRSDDRKDQDAQQIPWLNSLQGFGQRKSDGRRDHEAQQALLQNSLEAFGQKKSDGRRDHEAQQMFPQTKKEIITLMDFAQSHEDRRLCSVDSKRLLCGFVIDALL